MSSIKDLVYRLWDRLDGGLATDDSAHTYRELKGYITSGIALALKQNFYESLNADEYRYGSDNISITITQQVEEDAVTGLKYVDIPFKTINVAGNRLNSITSPNPVQRGATRYTPQRKEEVFVGSLQPKVPCVVLYYKEDNKFYFYNGDVKDTNVKVTQKYALPTDDEVDLGLDEYENQILQQAMSLTMQVLPSDRSNDGVPIN